jgi:hypothetical protein
MKRLTIVLLIATVVACIAAKAQTVTVTEQPSAPANVVAVGLSISQSGKAGVAAYGRQVISPAGIPVYTYSQVDFTGGLLHPAYTMTTGAAARLLYANTDKAIVSLYGLGDVGFAQNVVQTKLTLDTLTQFVKGGGVLATVKVAKIPFPVGVRLRYLQTTGGWSPEWTAVVMKGWN